MHDVIGLLNEHSIVTLQGLPGIGKTCLAQAVGNFVLERSLFRDGVVFLSLRGCESLEMLVKRVAVHAVKYDIKDAVERLTGEAREDENRVEDVLELCQTRIRERHMLLILDNCDEIMAQDERGLREFVCGLFSDYTAKVRVLLTSRARLGVMEGIKESLFYLREMSRK